MWQLGDNHTKPIPVSKTGAAWAIILAGGEGTRMRQFVRNWLGVSRPKQYCTFLGTRSMLEQAVARARALVPAERIITVIGQGHDRYLGKIRLPGTVIQQPVARDTGPGILLPAAYILERDPEATLLVFPSDHFIFPESRLAGQLSHACRLADATRKLVLLAATPDQPESDYGWIEMGSRLKERPAVIDEPCAREVLRFYEKPGRSKAHDFLLRGLLWNTMMIAVKGKMLWSQAGRLQPLAVKRLEKLGRIMQITVRRRLGARMEIRIPRNLFAGVPRFNFSTGFLYPGADQCIALPMQGLLWSDWGRPERVMETLGRMRKLALESNELNGK